MAILGSDDFAGVANAVTAAGRTLNNALGGTGSYIWEGPVGTGAAVLFGNGAGGVARNTDHAQLIVPAPGAQSFRARINPNGVTGNLGVFINRDNKPSNDTGAGNVTGLMILLGTNHTSLRVTEFVAGVARADRATTTITAPAAPFWLEIDISEAPTVVGRVLNSDLSVRNSVSHTFAVMPAAGGNYVGMGHYLSSALGAIFEDAVIETAVEADTLAPTLTTPTATALSDTTASGTVSTNESNGTLYHLTTTGATATATEVKAGASQAVTATGTQTVSITGLTASTAYYTHYLHRDAAGNDSAVSTTAQFTTAAPPVTLTTNRMTNNNNSILWANETGVTLHIYDVATGDKVATKTGQTSDAAGILTVTDGSLVAGTAYRYVVVLASGAEGLDTVTAA